MSLADHPAILHPHRYRPDPAPVLAEIAARGSVPGIDPCSLTTTTFHHEGKYVPQDRPNGRARRVADVDVFCWCSRKLVKVAPGDVLAGRTKTCSHPDCVAIACELPPPSPAIAESKTTDVDDCFAVQPIPAGNHERDYRLRHFDMQKFWDRVEVQADGCWFWTGARNPSGYGQWSTRVNGRTTTIQAHRIAYEMLVAPIPPGLEIDHLCRVRRCVSPGHLEAVTHSVNVRRGVAPERSRQAAAARRERALIEAFWADCGAVA